MSVNKIKKVLIAGIGGAGGSTLAEYLVAHQPDVEIHGIVRRTSEYTKQNLSRVQKNIRAHDCDLTNSSATAKTLAEVKPDAVFNLASEADVQASFKRPREILTNNILATCNLLEAVRLSEAKVVFKQCSSSEVYGDVDPKNTPMTEDCPIQPSNPYAVSKTAQDFLALSYFQNYGMNVVRTRAFGYVSARRTNLFTTAFAMQVARIEAGLQKELTHGDLSSVRTLIDARDIAAAFWAAALCGKPGEVYNIGGTATMSVGDFLEALKKKARAPIKTRQDPGLLRRSDMKLQVPDTTKFYAATKWEPKISFDEMLSDLLETCRARVKTETAGKI
jgi:GDP-4-dehydro-6-deoxy-D-mannose reductase